MFVCFFQALVSGGVDSTVCAALLHKVILLFVYLSHKTRRFCIAVGLKSNRTPGCQKCSENISDALSCALCAAS